MSDGTRGRGGRAVWVLLLLAIAAGVWQFYLTPVRQTANIDRVLEADAETLRGARSVSDVVSRMRKIDLTGCPGDFASVYLAHIHAWDSMAEVEAKALVFQKNNDLGRVVLESFFRGLLLDPFGRADEIVAELGHLRAEYEVASRAIRSTYEAVERSAVAHGAGLPRKGPATNDPYDDRLGRAGGLTAALTTGMSSHDFLLTNKSYGADFVDVDVVITFYREDGQRFLVPKHWSTWHKLETKTVRVPAHRYQKVEVKGRAVSWGEPVGIYDVWVWTWK